MNVNTMFDEIGTAKVAPTGLPVTTTVAEVALTIVHAPKVHPANTAPQVEPVAVGNPVPVSVRVPVKPLPTADGLIAVIVGAVTVSAFAKGKLWPVPPG